MEYHKIFQNIKILLLIQAMLNVIQGHSTPHTLEEYRKIVLTFLAVKDTNFYLESRPRF